MSDANSKVSAHDWCFRTETANLLGLSILQIHTTLTDGSRSINTLSSSFQELAEFCYTVQNILKQEAETNTQKQVIQITDNMRDKISAAIIAFQFYDRLTQRLDHVTGSLQQLGDLIKDDAHLNDPEGWKTLREHIKSSYTLATEHVMFEAIMKGASIEEALEIYQTSIHEEEPSDDIELF